MANILVKNTFVECLLEHVETIEHSNSGLRRQHSAPALLGSDMLAAPAKDKAESKSCERHERLAPCPDDGDKVKPTPAGKRHRFPWKAGTTTVMMRNLPNQYTQGTLLKDLQGHGFQACNHFDFFYLPVDRDNAANLGYAFINFCAPDFAFAFAQTLKGCQMSRFKSKKVIDVMPAHVQGYEANVQFYSATRVVHCRDLSCRPLFLYDPTHATFATNVLASPGHGDESYLNMDYQVIGQYYCW
eukprot:TRINITY_DN61_c0_g2_i1.p1 TRINITY_DN61_c0_g2~~TRINITY_DN61_c0_g2_i1.p1  ORF type:complete len:243 (-),score=25.56 TRINITY_DN61_c0_g2_i1:390-1118(-)